MKRTKIIRLILLLGLIISLAMGTASIAYATNPGWVSIDGKWCYLVSDDTVVTGWKKVGSSYYYFDENGIMLSGWKKIEGYWYYFASGGKMKTGWLKSSGKWYFFDNYGIMCTNEYRKGYWLDKNGVMSSTYQHGTWKHNSTGWWFQDGTWYPKNKWVWIDGYCYHFNSKGYIDVNTKIGSDSVNANGQWTVSGKAVVKNASVKKNSGTLKKHIHSYSCTSENPATCTKDGSKVWTCKCGDSYTETIKALGHQIKAKGVNAEQINGEWVATTCDETKKTYYTETCTREGCDYTKKTRLTHLSHNVITDKSVAPTCTKTGLTEGSHCSKCNTVFTVQEVIPEKGHKWKDTVVEPTLYSQGYTYHECTECGEHYEDNYTEQLDWYEVKRQEAIQFVSQYTYEVVPLIEPFNTYYFIKTDNPDPDSFWIYDVDTKYNDPVAWSYDGDGNEICCYKPAIQVYYEMFADVKYEDQSTKRVKGGYIGWSSHGRTDGGEMKVQAILDDSVLINGISLDDNTSVADTGITLTVSAPGDKVDYLISNYSDPEKPFFENLSDIQSAFEDICLYSGVSVGGKYEKADFTRACMPSL